MVAILYFLATCQRQIDRANKVAMKEVLSLKGFQAG